MATDVIDMWMPAHIQPRNAVTSTSSRRHDDREARVGSGAAAAISCKGSFIEHDAFRSAKSGQPQRLCNSASRIVRGHPNPIPAGVATVNRRPWLSGAGPRLLPIHRCRPDTQVWIVNLKFEICNFQLTIQTCVSGLQDRKSTRL